LNDARQFIEAAKFFRQETSITFEEFVLGIARIVQLHGLKPVDELIERYKTVYLGKKKDDF
jgi:hypothetical protein